MSDIDNFRPVARNQEELAAEILSLEAPVKIRIQRPFPYFSFMLNFIRLFRFHCKLMPWWSLEDKEWGNANTDHFSGIWEFPNEVNS